MGIFMTIPAIPIQFSEKIFDCGQKNAGPRHNLHNLIPRNNLKGYNLNKNNYEFGELEALDKVCSETERLQPVPWSKRFQWV